MKINDENFPYFEELCFRVLCYAQINGLNKITIYQPRTHTKIPKIVNQQIVPFRNNLIIKQLILSNFLFRNRHFRFVCVDHRMNATCLYNIICRPFVGVEIVAVAG